ncbi:MAG: USH1C-binding protein 1 [Desulfovibrionaceae bacterium]|nr:USH1C-binding protein 1 [Desulfovibrionaceae bacterium]
MTQIDGISQATSVIDLGPSGSLQLQYAKLQLALSEMAKKGALDYIDQIKKSQDEQKKVAEMLNEARQLQANTKKDDKKSTAAMSPEMLEFFRDKNLAYDKTGEKKIEGNIATNVGKIKANEDEIEGLQKKIDRKDPFMAPIAPNLIKNLQDKNTALLEANDGYKNDLNNLSFRNEEWEVAITSLKGYLDTVGINTQQLMVFVNDYMGQYNSYLQGANSGIQQSNQTLAELARLR